MSAGVGGRVPGGLRRVGLGVSTVAVLVGGTWFGAAQLRAFEDVARMAERLEALEAELREDSVWLARNQRLLQGYAQHDAYARTLQLQARRKRARQVLRSAYEARRERLILPLRRLSRRISPRARGVPAGGEWAEAHVQCEPRIGSEKAS